ncbi:MAG: hypothetical protein HOD63_03710 [Bacteroidetes bacterium]|nr:hypothetical protein [Bacteroidota bacterium]MBT5529421.1 hypothetical protein [Cytophagia bacterium]MBT3421525.1 hypothetical protein [Bacteroidota bacterium]MBT3800696.1 hypothetical protein [Bacteroidota bacterium]MBT3932631.1 hypothetical protein [Bacteroidota bacterium]
MFKVLLTILSIWVIYRFAKAILVLLQFKNSQRVDQNRSRKQKGDTFIKYVPKNKNSSQGGKNKIEYTDYEEVD